MDSSVLARIELGRILLRYGVAQKWWGKIPRLNPLYLATGEGEPRLDFEILLPEPEEIGAKNNDLFSDVIGRFADELRTLSGPFELRRLPLSWIAAQRLYIEFKRCRLESDKAGLEAFVRQVDQLELAAQEAQKNIHQILTPLHASVKYGAVKAQMPGLLDRLTEATRERGSKSALADHLKVKLASVSQWLSGARAPGGETTLRLLAWVQAEEAAQSKSRGHAPTRPQPKTRKRNSNENKSQSSPS